MYEEKRSNVRLVELYHFFTNKFNITGEQILDSYHMTSKLFGNCIFGAKMLRFCHYLLNFVMDVIT